MFTTANTIIASQSTAVCVFCHRDAFDTLSKPQGDGAHMHRIMYVDPHCRRCCQLGVLPQTKRYFRRAVAVLRAASSHLMDGEHPDADHVGPFTRDGAGGECVDSSSAIFADFVTYPEDDIGAKSQEHPEFFPAHLYDDKVVKEVFMPVDVLKAARSLINKSGATAVFGAKPPNDWLQVANLVSQGKHDDDYAYALCTVGAAAITDEVTCSMPSMTCSQFVFGEHVTNRAIGSNPVCGLAWQRYRGGVTPEALDTKGTWEKAPAKATRPNVSPPEPKADTPPGKEQCASRATLIDEQMGAHVSGERLQSTVVHSEHGTHVEDTRTAEGDVGARTARTRFPKASEKVEYLFNNDPENLVSAEAMRNVGVGVASLSIEQSKAFDEAVSALEKHMFTKKRIQAAERYIEKTTDVLPKNRTEEQRAQIHIDALNATGDESVPFSLLVDAFLKKGVEAKEKPRPIANHGNQRVWGMAKTAAVFEDVMFHTVPHACIKKCEKESKMNDLFGGLNDFLYKFENDLTAYEFGIYDRLKKAESRIFHHILKILDTDSDNSGFCYRVIDARDKACTWIMRYTDAAGAKCTMKIALPRTMRESGDRVTSSGNFFQNMLAWLTLMVKPGKVEAAVQSLIKSRGKFFYYVSARDSRTYKAYLGFEGDDTLGGMNESILMLNNGQLCKQFFKDYGWNAKMLVPSIVGSACVNFVGYVALMRNGWVVMNGANVVMFPDIKRIVQTKQWSTSEIPEEEYQPSVAVYGTTMMNEFRHLEPMYRFFHALRDDCLAAGGSCRKVNGLLKDVYFRTHAELGTDEEVLLNVPEPSEFLDGGSDYQELARVHAGEYTMEEYASMCGLTTLDMHGRELACYVPQSWLS